MSNLSTKQLETLVYQVNDVYKYLLAAWPAKAAEWRAWRDDKIKQIHHLYKPAARRHAGRAMGQLALHLLTDLGCYALDAWCDRQPVEEQVKELESQVDHLQAELARRPQTASATIPAQKVTLSGLQAELVRLVGAEGLGRSWRLIERALAAGQAHNPNSVRNALKKLIQAGVLDDYREKGRPVSFSIVPGGGRRLVILADKGRAWYKQAFGQAPAQSEIDLAARRHQTVAHGVAILEVRDSLRAAGHPVDDAPAPLLADGQARWGARSEPDLMVTLEGVAWPVEVQREASERFTDKWTKLLRLAGRLALVLFNDDQLQKQLRIFRQMSPAGEVLLASLAAMAGEWGWTPAWPQRPIHR